MPRRKTPQKRKLSGIVSLVELQNTSLPNERWFTISPVETIAPCLVVTKTSKGEEWEGCIAILPHNAPTKNVTQGTEWKAALALINDRKSKILKELRAYGELDQLSASGYKSALYAKPTDDNLIEEFDKAVREGELGTQSSTKINQRELREWLVARQRRIRGEMSWHPLKLLICDIAFHTSDSWQLIKRWSDWFRKKSTRGDGGFWTIKDQWVDYRRLEQLPNSKQARANFRARLRYLNLPASDKELGELRTKLRD